ncbi:NRDE family protein [Pedobacter gandavensis]|uniref:NRDE family protein n=1 Tax=Pedobacter gandavensis TaxID=2679963 RepID=UPI00292CCAD0|nr:NRDE family protein [Pedobacter gandavensis]
MCTVTFLPTSDGFYLSSNRDEHDSRGLAESPKKYQINGSELVFPKDPDKGGTWFAQKGNGDLAVLLNGAFVNHVKQAPYAKSRGLLLLEILSQHEPDLYFEQADLIRVEPFTLIVFTKGLLFEYRWDGLEKHCALPDPSIPHLWSSATLYEEQAQKTRQQWFRQWQESVGQLSIEKVLDLHRFGGTGDSNNDLVIKRSAQLMSTVSITSVFWRPGQSRMVYVDLKAEIADSDRAISSLTIDHKQDDQAQLKAGLWMGWASRLKRLRIRLLNWEYWPLEIVYLPVLPYWFWLSLKARSLFFFSAANPSIRNAGFAMCRKSSIYDLMSEKHYPKTLLCKSSISIAALTNGLQAKGLNFPLMAKPDMGERGVKVELLRSLAEVCAYLERAKFDFLIQEYIDFEQELGVFYYRIPGESRGHISGIVGKEFLGLTGDGTSTIEMLLIQEDRYFLQLDAIRAIYGKLLKMVLPAGSYYRLLPYGNHSRGAKFIDLSCKVNEELLDTINQVCLGMPDFYYGRLDLKFNSWEELNKGRNFSVIEVNGAASEPTHIYDPKHSIFFAWKEIIRHWRILYQISQINAKSKALELMDARQGMKMILEHKRYSKILLG